MNSPSRIYIQVLKHNQPFLENEVKALYPNWNLQSSGHCFLVYETSRDYSIEEIGDLGLSFSLGAGKYIGLYQEGDEAAYVESLKSQYECEIIHRWDLDGDDIEMGDRKKRGAVIDLFKEGSQRHLGVRFQVRGDFAPYKGNGPLPQSDKIDHYEYLVMAESFKHFRPLVAQDEIFLDINGHEGGRSFFLLEKGFRVIGLDPQEVSDSIKKYFDDDYLHLAEEFDFIDIAAFPGLPPIDWVVTKIKDNDYKRLHKIMKLLDKHYESKGMMLTVEVSQVNQLFDFLKMIEDGGYKSIKTGQVPSHKNEVAVIAVRE